VELIDTHCHLTFEQLAGDIEAVIERSRAAGVVGWITVGTDPQHNGQAIELTEWSENMYAAVGIHPHDAKDVTAEALDELKELARSNKVVAIGETGLDFHYDFSPRNDQRRVFEAQLNIASELNLPVIIHCREAFDETIDILEQFIGLLYRRCYFQERRESPPGRHNRADGQTNARNRLPVYVAGADAKAEDK
jgi:TatD DNase family protein